MSIIIVLLIKIIIIPISNGVQSCKWSYSEFFEEEIYFVTRLYITVGGQQK